jgi:type II secretory pathway pseudopilin PulG
MARRIPSPHPAGAGGFALTDILAALAVASVIVAANLSRSEAQNQAARTQWVAQQALHLREAIQAYMAANGGSVPTAAQLAAFGALPTSMAGRSGLVHAGHHPLEIGKLRNIVGDGRTGFVLSVNGLDAAACRAVGAAVDTGFPGIVVGQTEEDRTCAEGCHQAGVIARDFGGSLAAYEAAGNTASAYTKQWLAETAAWGGDNAWIAATADQFASNYNNVSPFGYRVKASHESPDSATNRNVAANLAAACADPNRRYNLKLFGAAE